MAKYRPVYTKFWSDPWIQKLRSKRKLLYLYLFTNEHCNEIGLYPISFRTMSQETGIDIRSVSKSIEFFEKEKRIIYDRARGEIWVKNYLKYQPIARNAPAICNDIVNTAQFSSSWHTVRLHFLAVLLQKYTGEELYVIDIISTIQKCSDQKKSRAITNHNLNLNIYRWGKISPKEMKEKIDLILKEIE